MNEDYGYEKQDLIATMVDYTFRWGYKRLKKLAEIPGFNLYPRGDLANYSQRGCFIIGEDPNNILEIKAVVGYSIMIIKNLTLEIKEKEEVEVEEADYQKIKRLFASVMNASDGKEIYDAFSEVYDIGKHYIEQNSNQ